MVQGRKQGNETLPGGVLRVDPQTGQCNWVLNNFLGLQFNSPHGPTLTSDGVIFYADATQGYTEGQVRSLKLVSSYQDQYIECFIPLLAF